MAEWDDIINKFWSTYVWDDDWINVKYRHRQRFDRAWINSPSIDHPFWTITLDRVRFETHDEAVKYLMGAVIFEDFLQNILKEQHSDKGPKQ
jgi:hypothetical protein